MNVRPATGPGQSPGPIRRPVRSAAERDRWSIRSSRCSAWCRTCVPARNVTEPERSSRTNARTAMGRGLSPVKRKYPLQFRPVLTTGRVSGSAEKGNQVPMGAREAIFWWRLSCPDIRRSRDRIWIYFQRCRLRFR